MIANLAAGVSGTVGAAAARRHRQGRASSDRGGDLRPRPRRRFNSGIVRVAREKIAELTSRGQGRQDHHHRPQGARPAAPPATAALFVENYEIGLKTPGLALVRPIAQQDPRHVRCRRVRRRDADLQPLQVGRDADADRSSSSSPPSSSRTPARRAFYEYEPDEVAILNELLPQNISVQLLSALLENQAGFFAVADDRDGQRHAQRRRPDQRAHHQDEPYPSGARSRRN